MKRISAGMGCILWFPLFLLAQADRGTITGLVTDPSGAAIPGATITMKNAATNLEISTTSGSGGNYSLPNLPVGIYQMTVGARGFRTYERSDVQLQVNQTLRLDVVMEVGEVTQTVNVVGEVPLIQTESTDVGTTINSKQFLDLPLTLGGGIRNPSSFILLSPGVNPGSTWEKHIGGGSSFTDMVYYDGIALSRGDLSNDAEVNPSVDAIGEFKLVTNTYSAEYAHAMNGVTSFTMKSGTNDLHGDVWYFHRDEHLNARSFFAPARAPDKQTEWGGTVGGPIVLPKIYNGKNRSFFFFSIDQFYRRGGQFPSLVTVPTSRMLQGDFGEWPDPVYDPATTESVGSGFTRKAFPNNVIPKSRWSRVSGNMIQYHPQPDLPGVTDNYLMPLSSPRVDQRHSGFKIDHRINSSQRISGMFNYTDRPSTKRPGTGIRSGDPKFPHALDNHNDQVVTTRVISINYDQTLRPTVLNHVGLGFSRFRNPNFTQSFNEGWLQPNCGRLQLCGLAYDLFPTVQFSQGYARYGDNIASDNFFNTYTALDTLSVVRGKHTLKFGFETQLHQDSFRNFGTGGGDFHFSQLETGQPGVAKSGNAWASFLSGYVDSASAFFKATDPERRYDYYGMFVDDTWKVTPKLTLNAGLRYEINTVISDRGNRLSYMDIAMPNPGAGNLPGAYMFAAKGDFSSISDPNYRGLAPRLGIAYSLDNKTVIRAGAGIYYGIYIGQGVGTPANGFSTSAGFSSGDNGISPAFLWDDGFPQNFKHPPTIDPTVQNGQGASASFRHASSFIPYSQQWNLTIERQFGSSLSISGAYVANKSTHVRDSNFDLNQVPDQHLGLGSLLQQKINSPAAQAPGFREPFPGFAELFGSRATVAQALRPFPQYTGVGVLGAPFGNSSYNSFQLKVYKRFSRGLSGTLAYTASKMLADAVMYTSAAGTFRQDATHRERSIYPTDQAQILTFSYYYELPIGWGKRFLSRISGLGSAILGGWIVSGVHSYSSGFPLSVSTANNLPIFNTSLRPDLTGEPIRASQGSGGFDPARDRWLNPGAFRQPAAFHFGSAPPYLNLRQPAFKVENFALLKQTKITERVMNEFRMEISNPLNRVVFGAPNTDIRSPNFGKITSTTYDPRAIQFGMKLIW
jgi:hypothetical protein